MINSNQPPVSEDALENLPGSASTAHRTRNERRRIPQRSANKVHFPFGMKFKEQDESARLVARGPRLTEDVELCEREESQINMAAKDVPKSLMHTEVLDSGCEVHIAVKRTSQDMRSVQLMTAAPEEA